jgi:tRNA threonylcarbamoyladenosine dehydratase
VDGRLQFPRLVPRLGSYGVPDYIERLYRGEGHSPSCAIGVTCASALLVSETLRAVREGPEALVCWPQYVYMDLYDHEYHIGTIPAPTETNPK